MTVSEGKTVESAKKLSGLGVNPFSIAHET